MNLGAASNGIPGKAGNTPKNIVVILAVVAVAAIMMFIFDRYSGQDSQAQEEAYASGSVEIAAGNALLARLCSGQQSTDAAVSCEDAVRRALSDTRGKVEKVSIGTMRVPDISGGQLVMAEKELWLVDIALDSPYADEKSRKQVTKLRIGISPEGGNDIYRRPIE